MITMTLEAALKQIAHKIANGEGDIQTDNHGQIIVYSNLFQHVDGSVQNSPDPEYDDDPTDA